MRYDIAMCLLAVCCASEPALAASSFSAPQFGGAPFVTADKDKGLPDAQADTVKQALLDTTPFVEMRYRHEQVFQKNIGNDAEANTLRTIAGFQTGKYEDFRIAAAIGNVLPLDDDTRYNDNVNNKTAYPKIGDPRGTQLQLANITWTGLPRTSATFGRQYIAIDNQRFIGTSNWRQTRGSHDAFTVKHEVIPDLEFFYGYIFYLNRSPGTRSTLGSYRTDTHAFHAAYTGVPDLKLSAYSYLVDLHHLWTAASPTDVARYSTITTGARGEWLHKLDDSWKITAAAEYARQSDYASNPGDYGLNYYTVEPGIGWGTEKARFGGITTKVGYEVMEGNGVNAVQTPLASMHSQNGWADIFSTTPSKGLDDFYVANTYKYQLPFEQLGPTKIQVDWHNFHSSKNNLHYGTEWDLNFEQPFMKYFSIGLQYADYSADRQSNDTRKFIVSLQMNY